MEAGRLGVGEFAFPGPLRDQLVAAIVGGAKTTTTGLLADYERDGHPLPRPGDRDVVIDSAGEPVTLIEIVAVRVIRISDVDLAHALGEGEGYATVADWRAGHEAFWRSAQMRGYIGDPAITRLADHWQEGSGVLSARIWSEVHPLIEPGTMDDDTLAVAVEFRVVAGEDVDLAGLLRRARAQAGAR
jgi:uncharacterized protein YhfF